MRSVAKAAAVFRIAWMERLAFRVNFVLEVASGILSAVIVVLVWMAVYRAAPRPLIGGYSLPEMVTYILGAGLVGSFILSTATNHETSASIQDGRLSLLLVQPLSPYWVWCARDLAGKAFYLATGLAGYAVVAVFFRDLLVPPASALHLLLFTASLALATILQFLLFQGASLLAFWMENTFGVRFTLRVVLEVAGGALIPVTLFPPALQAIFLALPFPSMIYLPMRIYLGKAVPGEVLADFAVEVAWIAGFAALNRALWKRGMLRYASMGD